MRKILILLLLLLLATGVESRRRRVGGRSGGRTGAVLGGGVVTLLKDLREGPQAMPKGYKREVERPVTEEYTLAYKAKQGLKGLSYLAYVVGAVITLLVVIKIYKAIRTAYLRYRISQLPPEEQEALLNEVMMLESAAPRKEVVCVDPEKTRELRLKNDQKRKLKR